MPSTFWSLISFRRWSPRTSAEPHRRPRCLDHDRQCLDQRRAGRRRGGSRPRRSSARPGSRPARARRAALGKVGRGRRAARDLDVRGVARVRERDLVLAGGTGRHVLVRAEAAHHADVRLDPVPAQPAAVEDAVVRLYVQLVGRVEALLVAIEAVGVLHDELARPQHAGARPRLVALLDLEVVEDQRQVAVGPHVPGDVVGDGSPRASSPARAAGRSDPRGGTAPGSRAPGPLPELRRLEHRHQHLLPADRVHLLADDLLDRAGARASPRAGRSTCPRRAAARARHAPSARARSPRRPPAAP